MAQRELMEEMEIDPSILVTLLNPLEEDGYVARERDPVDRRRHLVTLTAAEPQAAQGACRRAARAAGRARRRLIRLSQA